MTQDDFWQWYDAIYSRRESFVTLATLIAGFYFWFRKESHEQQRILAERQPGANSSEGGGFGMLGAKPDGLPVQHPGKSDLTPDPDL